MKNFNSQVAESTPFDNSTNEYESTNVQDAIEESTRLAQGISLPFQFIGQMNYPQYMVSGYHIVSGGGFRRSGDASNGSRFANSAPLISPITGEVFAVSAAITGVAQSTGVAAATVNVTLELWNVGMTGGEGTLLGTILIPISSALYTIGPWGNSSIVTAFEGGNDITPILVTQGQLLGVKFRSITGNSNVNSVHNLTILLQVRKT
jgi:hypothetical protein